MKFNMTVPRVCAAVGAALLGGILQVAPRQGAAADAGDAPQARHGTAGLTRTDGFVPFYWDAARGRVLIEITVLADDVLYSYTAATVPGSVEAPFDRGILKDLVIHFERAGPRVLVNQINLAYRAPEGTAARAEGVANSFPTSVLA